MNKYINVLLKKIENCFENITVYKLRLNMLMLLCIYSIVFSITLTYYGYFNFAQTAEYKRNKEIEAISSALKRVVQTFDNNMQELTDLTEVIYYEYSENLKSFDSTVNKVSYNNKFNNVIDTIFRLNKDISGISIYDIKNNTMFSSSNSYSSYHVSDSSRDLLKELLSNVTKQSNPETILQLKTYNNATNDLNIIKVFKQYDEKNGYGIVLTKHTDTIKKWFEGFKGVNRKAIVLLDDEGNLAFINGNGSLTENFIRENHVYDKVVNTSDRFITSINKEKMYVFYEKSAKYKFTLLMAVPEGYVDKYNFSTWSYMNYSSVLAIVVVGLVFFLFKRTIYNPIMKIEKGINGIMKGDMEFQIDVDKSSELYILADGLNSLITKLKDLINREYNSKILKKQAELNALQSQINPHFLYNTLDSIRGLALSEGVDRIANMTKALSKLFRYSISQKSNLVSFRDELKNVDNYIIIQQYRFNNKFNYIKRIEDIDNDILEYRIPKLSIQPIIENAIYHGLETKIGEGTIMIRAYSTEKRLIISIIDDGIGMAQDKLDALNETLTQGKEELLTDKDDKRSGIALINVNERIRLFFGDKYGVRVYSTLGQGTTIEIVLPKIKND